MYITIQLGYKLFKDYIYFIKSLILPHLHELCKNTSELT